MDHGLMIHNPAALSLEVEAIAALTASIAAIQQEDWARARTEWAATR